MGNALEWGWNHMPIASKLLILGVLMSIIGLTTPHWVHITTVDGKSSFGMWHFCKEGVCSSIHDNLTAGLEVPVWYHMTQVFMTIGCICATIAMFIATSAHHGRTARGKLKIKMSHTMNQMVVLMLFAGVLQMFTGLYTFVTYFEHTNFLYENPADVDFYGSFYCQVIGAVLILLGAGLLFFDEEVTVPVPKYDPIKLPEPVKKTIKRVPEPKTRRALLLSRRVNAPKKLIVTPPWTNKVAPQPDPTIFKNFRFTKDFQPDKDIQSKANSEGQSVEAEKKMR